jgi:hypothetical protein
MSYHLAGVKIDPHRVSSPSSVAWRRPGRFTDKLSREEELLSWL